MKCIISTLIGLPAVLIFGLFVWFTLYYPSAAATILVIVLLSYALGSKAYDRWILPKMGKPEEDGPYDGQGLPKAVFPR